MNEDKKDKLISAISTLLIVVVGLVICAFVGLNPPDPPIPEEGVEVNLGDSDQGLGNAESPEISENMRPNASAASSAGEQVSTQRTEQTVSMNTSDNNSRATQTTTTKPTEKTTTENNEPKINQQALFPGKSNKASGGSQGVTQGTGNQGKAGGDPNSQRYDGVPGNGGAGWSLKGRSASALPTPSYESNKEGKIIVKIWVDRSGKVTKAEAPEKGSTISDVTMVNKAKEAAMKAKFNADPNATEIQVGTITYVFRRNN